MKNTRTLKVSLLLCAALFVSATLALSQDSTAPIEGKVLLYKGMKPIVGLKISAFKDFKDKTELTSATTDEKGHFKLDALPAKGNFILEYQLRGDTCMCGTPAGDKDVRILIRDEDFHYMKIGEQSPELGMKEWVNSRRLTLASVKGKPVLLDFWGVTCPPCVAALPKLEAVSKKFEGKAVVIGVHDDYKINVAKLTDFAKKHGVTYPLGIDRGGDAGFLYDQYVTQGAPTVAVLDQNGKLALINCSVEEADAKIAELLAAK